MKIGYRAGFITKTLINSEPITFQSFWIWLVIGIAVFFSYKVLTLFKTYYVAKGFLQVYLYF